MTCIHVHAGATPVQEHSTNRWSVSASMVLLKQTFWIRERFSKETIIQAGFIKKSLKQISSRILSDKFHAGSIGKNSFRNNWNKFRKGSIETGFIKKLSRQISFTNCWNMFHAGSIGTNFIQKLQKHFTLRIHWIEIHSETTETNFIKDLLKQISSRNDWYEIHEGTTVRYRTDVCVANLHTAMVLDVPSSCVNPQGCVARVRLPGPSKQAPAKISERALHTIVISSFDRKCCNLQSHTCIGVPEQAYIRGI